jgi:methionyl-tRNA synthetase
VIPASADRLIALIDSGEGGKPIAQPTPIFPRLVLEEEEAA